jgi:hypothetical protein
MKVVSWFKIEPQEDEMLKAGLFRPRVKKAKFRQLIQCFSLDFIATTATKLIGIFAWALLWYSSKSEKIKSQYHDNK